MRPPYPLCCNCFGSRYHLESECPEAPRPLYAKELLRRELGVPMPANFKARLLKTAPELLPGTTAKSLKMKLDECANCWISDQHHFVNCPKGQLSIPQKEANRRKLGLPLPESWATTLNTFNSRIYEQTMEYERKKGQVPPPKAFKAAFPIYDHDDQLRDTTCCFNCWSGRDHGPIKCPHPGRLTGEREELRVQKGVSLSASWLFVLLQDGIRPKELRYHASEEDELGGCSNCWEKYHNYALCPNRLLTVGQSELIRVMKGRPLSEYWQKTLDMFGLKPRDPMEDARLGIKGSESMYLRSNTGPDSRQGERKKPCWNCWEYSHEDSECPRPRLKMAQKEKLRVELQQPFWPQWARYMEGAGCRINATTGKLERLCSNCWFFCTHDIIDCPYPKTTLFEAERIRHKRGLPLYNWWKDKLSSFGMKPVDNRPLGSMALFESEREKEALAIGDPRASGLTCCTSGLGEKPKTAAEQVDTKATVAVPTKAANASVPTNEEKNSDVAKGFTKAILAKYAGKPIPPHILHAIPKEDIEILKQAQLRNAEDTGTAKDPVITVKKPDPKPQESQEEILALRKAVQELTDALDRGVKFVTPNIFALCKNLQELAAAGMDRVQRAGIVDLTEEEEAPKVDVKGDITETTEADGQQGLQIHCQHASDPALLVSQLPGFDSTVSASPVIGTSVAADIALPDSPSASRSPSPSPDPTILGGAPVRTPSSMETATPYNDGSPISTAYSPPQPRHGLYIPEAFMAPELLQVSVAGQGSSNRPVSSNSDTHPDSEPSVLGLGSPRFPVPIRVAEEDKDVDKQAFVVEEAKKSVDQDVMGEAPEAAEKKSVVGEETEDADELEVPDYRSIDDTSSEEALRDMMDMTSHEGGSDWETGSEDEEKVDVRSTKYLNRNHKDWPGARLDGNFDDVSDQAIEGENSAESYAEDDTSSDNADDASSEYCSDNSDAEENEFPHNAADDSPEDRPVRLGFKQMVFDMGYPIRPFGIGQDLVFV